MGEVQVADSVKCWIAYEPSLAWWIPAVALLMAAGCYLISRLLDGVRRVLALVLCVFSILFAGAGEIWAVRDHMRALKAARSPETPSVEGWVQDFNPAPYGGHVDEAFTVDGVRFAYSDYVVTGGFRQTASHGGPVREGIYVRIRYIPGYSGTLYGGNLIVRLEVCPDVQQ